MKKDVLFSLMLKRLEPYFNYVILFLGIVTLCASAIHYQRPDLSGIAVYDFFSGSIFLLIYIYRVKLSLDKKLTFAYILLLGFSIISLYTSGFLGNGLLNLALLIVISMAFFSRKSAIILSSITVGVLGLFAILIVSGRMDLTRFSVARLYTSTDWVFQSLMLLVFATVCYFSVYSIKRMLVDAILQREEANTALKSFAFTDRLTELPNLSALFERFTFIQPEDIGTQKMVAIIDITDFKILNANYGFSLADEYLKAIGIEGMAYLSKYSENGIISRIGDNEFAIVVDSWTQDQLTLFLDTISILIRQNNSALTSLPQQPYIVAYTYWKPIESDFEHAFNQCTITIDYAKSIQAYGIVPFDNHIFKRFEDKTRVISDIENALNRDEFHVVFQGKWSAEASRFVGYEALTRWINAKNQFIPPDVFIPLINESTHLNRFNRYITEKILNDFSKIHVKNHSLTPLQSIKISINVSPLFFLSKDFTAFIISAVEKANLSPKHVVLEITEDVFIGDYREINKSIDELIQNGFQISLDDFGSGYSSLSHLNALTIHEIKVDKSIIQGVLEHPKSRILVETIATMGKKMGCDLVAEGVETIEQFQLINQLGFDIVQGYYFSKPIKVDEVLEKHF